MSHSKHLIQAKCQSLRPDTNELTVLLGLRAYLYNPNSKRPLLLLDLVFKELFLPGFKTLKGTPSDPRLWERALYVPNSPWQVRFTKKLGGLNYRHITRWKSFLPRRSNV
jgi:hypothetical protein